MWLNPQETADLVTFNKDILNGKLHFLCCAYPIYLLFPLYPLYSLSVNDLRSLIISPSSFIIDVWQGSKHAFDPISKMNIQKYKVNKTNCKELFFSCPEVFCKKGVLKNFAKFARNHLFQSLFFIKLQVWGLQPY